MTKTDLLVVGSGPAGMGAALEARRCGLEVVVLDDQSTPGGQIWRSVELARERDAILGPAYVEGRKVAEDFRSSGAAYEPATQLWQIEPGYRAFVSRTGKADVIDAHSVVLATGAQERPVPVEGWTLPGVMTVGAAQILLKNAGEIPIGPLWIAGSGPLPLLYAVQFLRAGGALAGYLDTTPRGQWRSALKYLPAALRSFGDIIKGLSWQSEARKGSEAYVRGATEIAAIGKDRIDAVRYRDPGGETITAAARTLLIHEGIVPNIHPALSLGCEMRWSAAQDCFAPIVNRWGETSLRNLFIAGDGAGIAGARAALLRGRLAGLGVAVGLDRLSRVEAEQRALPMMRRLQRELAVRPFLDALFRPRSEVFTPPDHIIVCRCEEVTAGQVRKSAGLGRPGPNQLKGALRAGMGPCQGRQCGYTITSLISEQQCRSPADVGFFRVRPPLRPVTLGELASLHQAEAATAAPTVHEE